MTASAGSATSYRDGVELALHRGFAAILGAFALSWGVAASSNWTHLGSATQGVVVIFLAVCGVVGTRALRGAVGGLAVTAVTFSALLTSASVLLTGTGLAPGLRNMPAIALSVAVFGLATRPVAMGAAVLALLALLASEGVVQGLRPALESSIWVVAAAVGAQILTRAVRTASTRADRAISERGRLQVEAAQASGRREALRQVQALLHDEIAAALRAISLPTVDHTEAREAATAAIRAYGARPQLDPAHRDARALSETVRALPRPRGMRTVLRVSDVGSLPPDVNRAFARAAREALRNVARHAGAQGVVISLVREAGEVVLTVEDDGAGLSLEGASGFGLDHSILQTMRDVGGEASIHSEPGGGVSVRLTWGERGPDADQPTPGRLGLLNAAVVDIRRPLGGTAVPYLAAAVTLGLIYTVPTFDSDWLWLAWLAGLVAITTLIVMRSNHGTSAVVSVGALTYALGGAIACILVMPAETLLIRDHATWPVGSIAPLLAVLVILRPPREALIGLAIFQGVVISLTAADRLGEVAGTERIMSVVPLAISNTAPTLLALALGQFILRLGRVVTEADHARRQAEAAKAAERARAAAHAHCLAGLHDEVLPFLQAVASELSPDPEGMRWRARELELAVRDEMRLPGALNSTARKVLQQARQAGTRVTIQADIPEDLPHHRLADLLTATLSQPPSSLECILTIRGAGAATEATLVTIPGNADHALILQEDFHGELTLVESTHDLLWAEWRPGG